MSNISHDCEKEKCFFCYEMNRLKIQPNKKARWTEWELKYLQQTYPDTKAIIAVINRSAASIWSKVHDIKKSA